MVPNSFEDLTTKEYIAIVLGFISAILMVRWIISMVRD
jgi:hypothetical protein